jgi:para-nitrobenzyl esterase
MKNSYAKIVFGPLIILLCNFSFLNSSAQCSNRYLDTVFTNIDSTLNIAYTTTAGGSTTELMDIYQPGGDSACLRHLVIFMHGGAFFEGTKNDGDIEYLCQHFAKRGYVCASLNYRLASSLVDLYDSTQIFTYAWYAMSDLKAAVRYFYKDAGQTNQWKIDTNVIFIGGSSAGGIASDFAGTLDSVGELETPFQTIANNNGGIEGNSGNAGYSTKIAGVASLAGAVNSLTWINPGTPPMVMCQGTADGTIPYDCDVALRQYTGGFYYTLKFCGSGAMAPVLDSAGVRYSLLPFPGSGHVPWDTNTVIMSRTDSAVAAFFYSVNCQQASGGCSSTDTTTVISSVAEGPQIYLFPNPATTQLHILQSVNAWASVKLFDCTGRKVAEQNGVTNQFLLPLDGLAQGIYILEVRHGDSQNECITRKVVIE